MTKKVGRVWEAPHAARGNAIFADRSPNSIAGPQEQIAALYYGRACAALVRVIPDDRWPEVWRMAWPDGSLSDLANLSRIKDAAIAICERGPPARNRRLFRWRIEPSKTASGGLPIRQTATPLCPTMAEAAE